MRYFFCFFFFFVLKSLLVLRTVSRSYTDIWVYTRVRRGNERQEIVNQFALRLQKYLEKVCNKILFLITIYLIYSVAYDSSIRLGLMSAIVVFRKLWTFCEVWTLLYNRLIFTIETIDKTIVWITWQRLSVNSSSTWCRHFKSFFRLCRPNGQFKSTTYLCRLCFPFDSSRKKKKNNTGQTSTSQLQKKRNTQIE